MKYLLALVGLFLMSACAHHRDVRPGENGENWVALRTDSQSGAYRKAMSEAEDYCEQFSKAPVILSEKNNYGGTMKETDYNNAKTAAKAASMAGGAVWALGGHTESNIGGVVGLGGAVANGALGEQYIYELKFKCQ